MPVITFVGGPKNGETLMVEHLTTHYKFYMRGPIGNMDEQVKVIELVYTRVPGQQQFYILDKYLKRPLI